MLIDLEYVPLLNKGRDHRLKGTRQLQRSGPMKTNLKQISKLTKRLGRDFSRDTSGAVALVLGLAIVPMVLAGGLAIDFYRAGSAKAQVQASLDASVLAGAAASPNSTEAERTKAALDAFEVNLRGGVASGLKGTPDVSYDNGRITVSYSGDLPTSLLAVGGFNDMTIGASSTATMNKPARAEIVLALDYSGSMDKISSGALKYVTMKNAAIDMVNGLTDNGKNTEVRFGLVPFSHHVYTTLPSNMVVGATGGTWTGCTQDRQYPYNTQVAAPQAGNDDTKWGQPQAPVHSSEGCGPYPAKKLVVRELTGDHSGTTSQLQAMRPNAWTHIALGMEFAWQVVDPGAPYAARSFSDDENKKFIVLLTDGKQTEPGFGPGNSRTVSKGEANLTTLCENVKSSDITVITIAFDLDDAATEARLRNCATDPDKHFFKAEDGYDLTRAFEEIQSQIATAIYLAK
jgi:Flp pilus assembly protein TadG